MPWVLHPTNIEEGMMKSRCAIAARIAGLGVAGDMTGDSFNDVWCVVKD
jgi:hypothetical protein